VLHVLFKLVQRKLLVPHATQAAIVRQLGSHLL
jgi:hypothetical protein